MKNLFKKHDLFKILFFTILVIAILTWFIPTGTFTNAIFADKGMARVGIIDFFMTTFYSVYYYLLPIIFIIAVGGLYGVLAKSNQYSTLVVKIARKLKGKETLFIILTALFLAVFTSINNQAIVGFIFVPFIINILSKLKVGKFKSFCATFGAIIVGELGSTYGLYSSTVSAERIYSSLNLTVNDAMGWKVGIFAIAFILLMAFIFMKRDGNVIEEETVDNYELEPARKSVKTWKVTILLSILGIITILGYISWTGSFNVTIFDEIYTSIVTFKIGDTPLFSYLLGSMKSFGNWDLFTISFVSLIVAFIVAMANKLKVDGFIEAYADGIKKIAKPLFLYILVNCAFVIMYWSPIIPTITQKLIPAGAKFNIFILIIVTIISSIMNVDHNFTGFTIGAYLGSVYAGNETATMLILNSIYGFTQFIIPTSVILMIGLSYLNISYKEYLKYMWKYLVGLLGLLVLIQVIFVYV